MTVAKVLNQDVEDDSTSSLYDSAGKELGSASRFQEVAYGLMFVCLGRAKREAETQPMLRNFIAYPSIFTPRSCRDTWCVYAHHNISIATLVPVPNVDARLR